MVRYNRKKYGKSKSSLSKSKSSLNKRKKTKKVNRRKSGGKFTDGLKYIGQKGIEGGKYLGEKGIEGVKATGNYIKNEYNDNKLQRIRNQSKECMDTPDCSEAIEKCKKRKSEAIKNITEMNIKKSNGFMLVGKNCGDDWVNDCSTSLTECNKRITDIKEFEGKKSIKAGSKKKRKTKTKKAKTKKAKTKKAKTKKKKSSKKRSFKKNRR